MKTRWRACWMSIAPARALIGTYEYEPIGADNSLVATGLPQACLVSDPAIVLGKPAPDPDAPPAWDAGARQLRGHLCRSARRLGPEHLRIVATTPHCRVPGVAAAQLSGVAREGEWARHRFPSRREDGLMAVPVPQGDVDLTVDWTTTTDVLLAPLAERAECAGAHRPVFARAKAVAALGYHEGNDRGCEIADSGRRGADRPGAGRAASQRDNRAGVDPWRDAPLDLCRRQAAAARAGHAGRRRDCRRTAQGNRAAGRGPRNAAHLFADPRRPAGARQRRSAPRQAHLPRGLWRSHRDSCRRRAADARLRSAGRPRRAAGRDRADHRPDRQRHGHGGRHDRRPGAGSRKRTPEAHAASWWKRSIAPRPAR